jgi:predicted nucleic acid-binding Zn ribbon protein
VSETNVTNGIELSPTKSNHPLYMVWWGMKHRCYGKVTRISRLYQEKGINVCDRWRNDFWAFVKDMGPKPTPEHSLDRIDNNGDYTPENCRWATRSEQQRNTRMTRIVALDDEAMSVSDLSEKYGIDVKIVKNRLRMGWSVKDAVSRPIEPTSRMPDDDPRAVSRRCYASGMSLQEIGELLGVTKERVRQYLVTKTPVTIRHCVTCGRDIPPNSSRQKYCREECRPHMLRGGVARFADGMKSCEVCGELYPATSTKRFCSTRCSPSHILAGLDKDQRILLAKIAANFSLVELQRVASEASPRQEEAVPA